MTLNTLPLKQEKTIDDVMFSKKMIEQVQFAAPRHLDAERLIRLCLTTIKKNKDLMDCWRNNQASVLASFLESVSIGLEIDSRGLAYLIPYKGECTFQPSFKGLISLAMRSGKLRNIYAEVVYESEASNLNIELGLLRSLTHKFDISIPRKGKILLAYAVAVFVDGATHFEFVQSQEIERAKRRSQSANGRNPQYSPWNTDEPEMWKKTAIKRLCKTLDLSPELMAAVSITEAREAAKEIENAPTLKLAELKPSASDMSIYTTPAPAKEPEVIEMEAVQDPSAHDKAIIRLNELAGVNQHLVDKHLAGRNPDNMSADEIYGVIDAVEDGMR